MKVYDFMKLIGEYTEVDIAIIDDTEEDIKDYITKGGPTTLNKIITHKETREKILDSMDYNAILYDIEDNIICCREEDDK